MKKTPPPAHLSSSKPACQDAFASPSCGPCIGVCGLCSPFLTLPKPLDLHIQWFHSGFVLNFGDISRHNLSSCSSSPSHLCVGGGPPLKQQTFGHIRSYRVRRATCASEIGIGGIQIVEKGAHCRIPSASRVAWIARQPYVTVGSSISSCRNEPNDCRNYSRDVRASQGDCPSSPSSNRSHGPQP